MQVASKELCEELYKVSGWISDSAHCITDEGHAWVSEWQHWYKDRFGKYVAPTRNGLGYTPVCPAYNADYLLDKIRNYDFTIVNLNRNILSLTSDSLDDPEAAILGKTLTELLAKLAIQLFKQNILTPENK